MPSTKKSYIDKRTNLPVRCPVCGSPYIIWRTMDWFCEDCAYEGEEALFPSMSKDGEGNAQLFHPQPPEQHLSLDLDSLSAAFLQRLSRRWSVSPQDAVVTLIKTAAKAEFSQKEEHNGKNEVRDTRERRSSQSTTDYSNTGILRELSPEERRRGR